MHGEFGKAARTWREAATMLDRILVRVGASRAAPRALDSAAGWLTGQQGDLLRRRDELIKSDGAGAGIAGIARGLADALRLATLAAQLERSDPKLAAELRRAGVSLSKVPLQGTPRDTAAWWNGLTKQQQNLYIEAFPQVIGWLDGVPARHRDRANRLTLAKRIEELYIRSIAGQLTAFEVRDLARLEKLHAKIKSLEALASVGKGPKVFLLGLDSTTPGLWDGYGPKPDPWRYMPPGKNNLPPDSKKIISNSAPGPDGRIILALGDPDKAAHTGIYVPGTTTKLDGFSGGDIERIQNMWEVSQRFAQGKPISTIAWLDYDAPDAFTDAADGKYAGEGGPKLDRFIDGVRAAQGEGHQHLTLIGHSYGSTVIGEGARTGNGINVDDIIAIGSPGMKVAEAGQLHMNPNRVWSELAEGDHVANLGRSSHGAGAQQGPFLDGPPIVPSDREFGAQRLTTDTAGHSDYWKNNAANGPPQSLLNQVKVMMGTHLDSDPFNDPRVLP